jgi:hypothetical protein
MIARTVNNLVPSQQLKLDVFKIYVSSDVQVDAIIDVDVLPNYA